MAVDGLGTLLDVSPVAIVELDATGMVRRWNPAAEQLLGWPASEVIGRPLPTAMVGRALPFLSLLRRLSTAAPPVRLRVSCWHRSGEERQVDASFAPLHTGEGRLRGVMAVLFDVTNRHRRERRLRYRAEYDSLTGLPNRDTFVDRLERALARGARDQARTGVLMIDLNKFKQVNDSFGHATGDRLLAQVGPRLLAGVVRTGDAVARLAGDEFAILLPGLVEPRDAVVVAQRVRGSLSEPFALGSVLAEVSASVGVALAPDHGGTPEELLHRADMAMYEAKHTATGLAVYQADYDVRATARTRLISEFQDAPGRGELVVHYQPKIEILTHVVAGVEALVRWRHPRRGLLLPSEFLPTIEAAASMTGLTDHVLDAALAQARRWMDADQPVPVSVNLSAQCLRDPDLPDRVTAMLERHGVPPAMLSLDVTETSVLDEPGLVQIVVGQLADSGIALSVDNYGVGHAAPDYLRRLPASTLSMDRSFMTGLTETYSSAAIVRSAVELGHSLGLNVIAEGVEDADTLTYLTEVGCDIAQGFFFAPAMSADDLTEWLTQFRQAEAIV